jgi:hypothetical protein
VVVAEGKGCTVDLQVLSTTGVALTITLTNVYFTPQFTTNIFSTNYFMAKSNNHAVHMSAEKHMLIGGDGHNIALSEFPAPITIPRGPNPRYLPYPS